MFPTLLFDLKPNYGGGNEDNGDLLQKVSCTKCYTQCPQPCSRPAANPRLCQRLLDTPGQVWVGLLCGHCSFLLGPGEHKVLFVPSQSVSQSCVSSGGSMVGLMATSSERASAIPRSAAPRAPDPVAVHCWPILPQETPKHSSVSVSWGLWVLVCTRYVWAFWASLVGMGFDSKCDFTPPATFLGLLLCPWMWDTSSQLLQHHEAAALRSSRTNTPKRCPLHYKGLECKSRKSRNTWSNGQIWP